MKDKPVILVVDDQPQNIELLEAYLVPQGYDIVTAANGEEALGKLSGNPIDLILLDVMMPGMDGFEVIRRVRQDHTHRLLPIILVTSLRETEDRIKGIEAGCDDFISKPVDKMELLARVRSLLKVKAYNDLMSNYQKELEAEVSSRTWELKSTLETLQHHITERKQAEEALRELNAYNRSLIEASIDPLIMIGPDGKITDVNAATEQVTGRTRDVLIGSDFSNYFSDPEVALVGYRRVFTEGHVRDYPLEIRHCDGHVTPVLYNATLYHNEKGEVSGIFAAARDITEQKLAEEWLLRERSMVERIMRMSPAGITVTDRDGKIIFANKRAEEIYGRAADELTRLAYNSLGWLITDFDGNPFPLEKLPLAMVLSSGNPVYGIRHAINSPEGRRVYISINGAPIHDGEGNIKEVVFSIDDVTDLKQAEETLKESEKKYRLLADNVNDVIFALDMNLNYTYVSPSIKILRGYEPEEVLKQPSTQTLTPSSMDLAIRTLSEIMELEKTRDRDIDTSRTLQLEMVRKDKTTVWTEVKFSFIRDKDRLPVGILGVTRDITERKQAEDELKQSEERYRSVFENAQEGIFRSIPEGRFIMANQAMANMIGYKTPEELMTSVTDISRQLYVDPEERAKIKQIIKEQGFLKNYETQFYRKDGSIFWISLTMQAVRDEKGQILYYEGMNENITNRKENEGRIKKALGATVQAIAITVETRDPYTAGHQRRVADLARAIATEMNLPADQIDGIRMAAAIHDLGKISVPAELLSKPSKLTALEFGLIKTHAQSGYDILKDIEFPWPVAMIVLEHHERMNGSGYPNGLAGDNILMESRIIAVADVVESMGSHRPYRPSLGIEAALEEIEKNRGTHYDNAVADACLRLFREKEYQLS